MAERKRSGIRRVPALENDRKQADQMLSTAGSAPELESEAANRQQDTVEKKKSGQNTKGRSRQRPEKQLAVAENSPAKNAPAKPAAPKPVKKTPQRTDTKKKDQKNTNTPRNAAASEKKQTAQTKPVQRGRRSGKSKAAVKVYFLGGLNEIGKNFTLFEYGQDMLILDCGLAFPDEDMYGIDVVIPDFTFVEKNKDKIRGIVITHGHEDHIGGLPYLLKKINVPVYGTALTIGLIEGKLREHNLLGSRKLVVTPAGTILKFGAFDVELIHVNHSIADAVALAIKTPAGVIIHTGDFKIDFTPAEGDVIDLARFAEIGKEGVLALLADSTNAERPGYTKTEQMVNNSLDTLFGKADGKRIIIATFASNISRVQQIINCAVKYGRKVALSGRSMLNVMGIATNLGYLHIPEGLLIDIATINRYHTGEVVLITTGSQGEPMSALTRMAFADHRQVELSSNDFIILSARPIPGNEKTVGTVVDELMRRGCTVIYESVYDVHVSGHACQEELKIIHSLVKPKYFIPVHGEQKHLRRHASIAIDMGMDPDNILIGDIGCALEICDDHLKQLESVPAGDVMVDGLGVGDVGNVVLGDRKHLAEDGIIIVVTALESKTGKIMSGPDILSRGFVYVRESEKLMDEARKIVYNTIQDCIKGGVKDWAGMKQGVKDSLSRFLYRKTQRSPMILPIIVEI